MDRVKKCFRTLLCVSLVYSILVWGLVELVPGTFASIYTPESSLIEYAVPYMRIYLMMLGLMGILISCQMTFVSIGSALSSVSIAMVRKIVLLIPLIYIMPSIFTSDPVKAVFFAEPVADVLAITFTVIVFSIQFPSALKKRKIV